MSIKHALILAAGLLGLAWLSTVAVSNDWITVSTSERLRGAAVGLVLAAFANVMPKTIRPLSDARLGHARAQNYRRFAGWTFALAGVGYALVRLTFPMPLDRYVSMGLVAGSIVIVLGMCLFVRGKPETPARS